MRRDVSLWSSGRGLAPVDFIKDTFGSGFLDDFFNRSFMAGFSSPMRTDIKETENSYIMEIEMPGFSKDNIRVECVEGRIKVSAQHTRETDENRPNLVRQERHYGRISRSYSFEEINEERVSAEYKDGILRIDVPKQHESTPGLKKIEIH